MTAAPGALYRWLAATASEQGRAPALTFLRPGTSAEVTYTYEHLFEQAEKLGTRLEKAFSDPSTPLGLLLSSQEDQVVHYLAALSIGVIPGILTPPNPKLNRGYYGETMREVLRRSQFGAVVTDVENLDLKSRTLTPYTFTDLPGPDGAAKAVANRDRLDASFIQFSSGTTGIKRGVLVNDGAVIAQLRAYGAALGLEDDDCIVSWLPLYHDMGFIACLNMPLAYGVHTVMIDPIDWVTNPAIYLQMVSKFKGTLSWHPNFAYSFMAERVHDQALEEVRLSSLRGLVNCSEPVTFQSQQAFVERFLPWGLSEDVFNGCYAMAETTFALTHGSNDDPLYHDHTGPNGETGSPGETTFVSVGRPLPDVVLAVMNPGTSTEVAERDVGEIWVRSPFNFTGYYNDDEATRRAFVGDWYRTGDLGYRIGDAFYVVGRLKDVLIVAGVNVFPQDLEDTVSRVDGVHPGRVSAFSDFDDRLQTEHVVILAESDHHDADTSHRLVWEIRQRIQAAFQLANFKVSLVPRGWLVKSTSGKMARSANQQKWNETYSQVDDT